MTAIPPNRIISKRSLRAVPQFLIGAGIGAAAGLLIGLLVYLIVKRSS
jgi:hypothetical protein